MNADADDEVALVARRMRLTLMEVIGDEEGQAMYSMEWLSTEFAGISMRASA